MGMDELVASKSGKATARLINREGPPSSYKRQPLSEPVNAVVRPSVVVPFYNRDEMVFECVESIVLNAPVDCEVIVVDDGSDDPTVIPRLQAAYPSIICLRLPENAGVSVARNRGNSVATGSVIIDVDSDDVVIEGAIQSVVDAIEDGADYVYGDVLKSGADGAEYEVVRPDWKPNLLLSRGCFVTGMKAYRKVLWQRVGGFDESLRSAVDLDFALKAEEAGAIFSHVPWSLVVYREHEGQISRERFEEQNENARQVLDAAKHRRSLV